MPCALVPVVAYLERRGQTFNSVHVDAAARMAMNSRESGVAQLADVSGIGADAASHSPYVRSREEGAVRAALLLRQSFG
jgi:uncharacterized protein YbjT (DUF2867 family)